MILTEKYRPKTIDEIIGQKQVVAAVKNLIKHESLPHMLFTGPAGVGKTTMAYAIANETGTQLIELNASNDRGIDTIRERIKLTAESVGKKIILLDEADQMTAEAQSALRRIMEISTKAQTTFILTANEDWRIIDPIKSRCVILRFTALSKEEMYQIFYRVLKGENIKIAAEPEKFKEVIDTIIEYTNGDVRKSMNIIETLINENKEISVENVIAMTPVSAISIMFDHLANGRWEEARKQLEDIILQNSLNYEEIIKQIYNEIDKLNLNQLAKLKVYISLAEAERGIKLGANPVIQLASVLASAYAVIYK